MLEHLIAPVVRIPEPCPPGQDQGIPTFGHDSHSGLLFPHTVPFFPLIFPKQILSVPEVGSLGAQVYLTPYFSGQ